MTSLAGLALPSPRLPIGSELDSGSILTSAVVHLIALGLAFSVSATPSGPEGARGLNGPIPVEPVELPRLVFLQALLPPGGGGGGGGNGQSAPIRHAESIGDDAFTLRVDPTASKSALADAVDDADLVLESFESPEGVLLDVKPMASGTAEQVGLPEGGAVLGTATGPGSGGGIGTGVGSGIGSGQGPGLGPGSGGGSGGGAYRVGGAVSSPRVLAQVQPVYTPDALARRVQGSVVLELVVTPEGLPSAIRTVRSLDPGLDAEAIRAVRQWRFAPGRLAGSPVDVQVIVVLDFFIR